MTAREVVRTVRVPLVMSIVGRALCWAGVVVAASLLLVAAGDALAGWSLTTRRALRGLAVAAGVATAVLVVWRNRRAASLTQVALWLEERFPSLQFALVTQLELEGRGASLPAKLPRERWTRVAWTRGARSLVIPVVVLILVWAAVLLIPAGAVARARSPHAGDSIERSSDARESRNRLAPLVATLTPPAYSGLARVVTDDPTKLEGLVGSAVTVEGRGNADGLTAIVGDSSVPVRSGWSARFRMPARAAALRLRDGARERIVTLEPRADAPPTLMLLQPARDSVLRVGTGRITLMADASDDLGLERAAFELIVSSGEGENFTFRSTTLGLVRPTGNTKSASISATLSLDSLELKPGDLLHLRAVAHDRNDITGPGVGVSETRTLRIARTGEYDSVSVEAAAPPEGQSVISQRMLIMMAEALERRRPRLSRRTVLDESSRISGDQKKLRRSVGDIVFARLGEGGGEEHTDDEESSKPAKTPDELLRMAEEAAQRAAAAAGGALDFEEGESPVVAINRPLLEAYRAMWDATMELDQGEPARALPHMRRALAAIQRARQAERIYLRGRPPAIVVDLAKVRLTGKDRGAPAARVPRTRADSARARLENRFAFVVGVARRAPAAAVDSLILLRIDALESAPRFASALDELARTLRAGDTTRVDALLARARRELVGAPVSRGVVGAWSIVP